MHLPDSSKDVIFLLKLSSRHFLILYSTTPQTAVSLTQGTYETVTLGNTLPASNVNVETPNTIIVQNEGIYEVSYNAVVSADNTGDITLAVRRSNANLDGTEQVISLVASTDKTFSNSSIVELEANDSLTLGITASTALNGTIDNANLIVKQIS